MAIKSGRPVEAAGTPLDISFDDQDAAKKFEFLSETLRFRAQKTPEHVLFSLLDSKVHVWRRPFCLLNWPISVIHCHNCSSRTVRARAKYCNIPQAHVAHKYTCSQLHRKAERIAGFTLEKAKLNSGDNVALLFPAGLVGQVENLASQFCLRVWIRMVQMDWFWWIYFTWRSITIV